MKRLNFDNASGVRFLCTKGEVNRMMMEGKGNYTVVGSTPKGVVVEFTDKKI